MQAIFIVPIINNEVVLPEEVKQPTEPGYFWSDISSTYRGGIPTTPEEAEVLRAKTAIVVVGTTEENISTMAADPTYFLLKIVEESTMPEIPSEDNEEVIDKGEEKLLVKPDTDVKLKTIINSPINVTVQDFLITSGHEEEKINLHDWNNSKISAIKDLHELPDWAENMIADI